MIDRFAAVTVARQASRAGVMSAISAVVLAPVTAPLVMTALTGSPPPASFTIPFALVMAVVSVLFSVGVYRLLYVNSPRLLKLTAGALRLAYPLTYVYFVVPLVLLSGAADEPLLVLYAAALSAGIVFLLRFVRWSRSYATEWVRACGELPPHVVFAPLEGRSWSFMFRELFSLPQGWLVSRGRTVKIVALVAAALLLEGLAVAYVLQSSQSLTAAMRLDLPNLGVLTDGSGESQAYIAVSSIIAVVFPLLSLPVLALSSRTRRAARKVAVHSMKEAQATDTRAPLLFLRSFSDDQVALPQGEAADIFARTLTHGSAFATVDELLTERYTYAGPVIAIGKPGEQIAPFGAARAYLADKDWHTVVGSLMDEARAVVLSLDHTEGVAWELRHAQERGHLHKTIIIVPPDHHRDVDLATTALALTALDGAVHLDQCPAPPVAILPGPGDRAVVVCADRVDSHTYGLILRMGLQTILERSGTPAIPELATEDREELPTTTPDPSTEGAGPDVPQPRTEPVDATPTAPIAVDATPTISIPMTSSPTVPIPVVRIPSPRTNTGAHVRPRGADR